MNPGLACVVVDLQQDDSTLFLEYENARHQHVADGRDLLVDQFGTQIGTCRGTTDKRQGKTAFLHGKTIDQHCCRSGIAVVTRHEDQRIEKGVALPLANRLRS